MATLVVRAAREHRMAIAVVANRTRERAEALARDCDARAISIESFVFGCEPVDALVAATSSARYVLERAPLLALARRTPSRRPLVAVDISVPRNVEPVDDPAVEVVDLEALRVEAERNRAERARAAADAEQLIERKLSAFGERALPQAVTALLADVSAESRRVLEREIAQLFTGKLEHLGGDDRAAVERWARTALGRIQHVPIQAIKRLAADGKLFDGFASGTARESEMTS
jgi:glutamyl-tRNA reductase